AVLVLFLLAIPILAHAQSFQFQYAAKFVCGKAPTSGPLNFAPGTYFTTINVYNTSSVAIDKRIVVALPNEKPGGATKPITVVLKNGEAMQIDCKNILGHLSAA